MSTEPVGHRIFDTADLSSFLPDFEAADRSKGKERLNGARGAFPFSQELEKIYWPSRNNQMRLRGRALSIWKGLSPWSQSAAKRIFDCVCVLVFLPLLLPLMLAIALAVRLTSHGPVLFLQERVGRRSKTFTILKFRTMVHVVDSAHNTITTSDNQRFTRVGPFLRRWKLDELPQLLNVLWGDMSLVGPRPKVPEHVSFDLPCRPGITGMATTVFACEERILACVANDQLDAYYHSVVLPAKRRLDSEYMASATFVSDLRLLVNSVLRRWDTAALDEFIEVTAHELHAQPAPSRARNITRPVLHMPSPVSAPTQPESERVSLV